MNLQFGIAWALSQALIDALWQLALLGCLAGFTLGVLRAHAAALRHFVGMLFLLAMLLLPLATLLRQWPNSVAAPQATEVAATAEPVLLSAGALAAQVAEAFGEGWFVWIAQGWLVGVLAVVAVQFGSAWRLLRSLDRGHQLELPAPWQAEFERLRGAMGIARQVSVRLAARVGSPFTARVLRPVIWLPLSLLDNLPTAQIRALLAHELAHIVRLDWLWNGLQCVIEALLFFHPAVWWLSRRIRQDRELACDALAVRVDGDGLALAEALHALARHGWHAPTLMLSAQGGPLLTRVSQLLQTRRPRALWRAPVAVILLATASTLFAMQAQAPLLLLSNVHIEASSNGALGPGQSRELRATNAAGQRVHYRLAMDAQGRLSETYTENGRARLIDDQLRESLRLAQQSLLPAAPGYSPAPPVVDAPAPLSAPALSDKAMPGLPVVPALADVAVPDLPPVPALDEASPPEAPPLPPAPPPVPAVDDSNEFLAISAALRTDARVLAMLGTQAQVERGSFDGYIQCWEGREQGLGKARPRSGGQAKFKLSMRGEKGSARISASASLRDGTWNLTRLALLPHTDADAARTP